MLGAIIYYSFGAKKPHSSASILITHEGKIERLHNNNHHERDIWHDLKKEFGESESIARMHDLLHEGKEALHTLGEAHPGSDEERTAVEKLRSFNEEERDVFHQLRKEVGETDKVIRLHDLLHQDKQILSELK